jgi:hypothetical protein
LVGGSSRLRCIQNLTQGAEALADHVSSISSKIDQIKGIDEGEVEKLKTPLGSASCYVFSPFFLVSSLIGSFPIQRQKAKQSIA